MVIFHYFTTTKQHDILKKYNHSLSLCVSVCVIKKKKKYKNI